MFCRYCGNQIPDDSRFCRHCGKPVAAEGTPPPRPEPAQADTSGPKKTQRQRETRSAVTSGGSPRTTGPLAWAKAHKIIAILACVALAAVCGIGYDILDTRAKQAAWAERTSKSPGGGREDSPLGEQEGTVVWAADPGSFFGVEPDQVEELEGGRRYIYTMALNHTVINEYLDALETHYDLKPQDTQKSIGEELYFFDAGLTVDVAFHHAQSNMVLALTCGENIRLEESGVESSKPGRKVPVSGSSTAPDRKAHV